MRADNLPFLSSTGQKAATRTVLAGVSALVLVISLTAYVPQLLGHYVAGHTGAIATPQKSFAEQNGAARFTLSHRLAGAKDGMSQVRAGPTDGMAPASATMLRLGMNGGKKRKGHKRKGHKHTEVLPLEREAAAAATVATEFEDDIEDDIEDLEKSNPFVSHWDEPAPAASGAAEEGREASNDDGAASASGDAASGDAAAAEGDGTAGAAGGDAAAAADEDAATAGADDAADVASGDAAVGGNDATAASVVAATDAESDKADDTGKPWEDGNLDDEDIELVKVTEVTSGIRRSNHTSTAPPPLVFVKDEGRYPTAVLDEIADLMQQGDKKRIQADATQHTDEASANTDTDLTLKQKETKKRIVECDVTETDLNDMFDSHDGAALVSVGVFVINAEHGRRRQKKAAADGEAGIFVVDMLIYLNKPDGSTIWTDDSAVWDTLSFRNVDAIYHSYNLPGVSGVRRVQASFFYDTDLSMYPLDQQELKIILQQTKETSDKWVFVPSAQLNGLNREMHDIHHKYCSGDVDQETVNGKEYSMFTFTLDVRKPRWFAVITAFIPPTLMILPVMLGYTLGPMSWYPLRFMLSGCSFVSLAFFYDSFLKLMPMLFYLTAFDKYIYCLYLWLIASVVSLLMLLWVYKDSTHEHAPDKTHEGLLDETPLFMSVGLRDDLLHLSLFSGLVTLCSLFLVFLSWLWLPDVVWLFIVIGSAWFYFWWLLVSYHRVKRKHGLEQDERGGFSRVLTKQDVEKAKGRAFHFEMMLCCCYQPMIDICIEECCCCCVAKAAGGDDTDRRGKKDEEFPVHLYSPKPGDGGLCAICKKAGYKECIFGGHRHSTSSPSAALSDATVTKAPEAAVGMAEEV